MSAGRSDPVQFEMNKKLFKSADSLIAQLRHDMFERCIEEKVKED